MSDFMDSEAEESGEDLEETKTKDENTDDDDNDEDIGMNSLLCAKQPVLLYKYL